MENIGNYVKESLSNRSIEVLNHIASTNPQYKQFTKEISALEDQLTRDLSQEEWELLDKHRDLYLQRKALIVDLVYLQGFVDGSGFKSLLGGENHED